VGRSLNEFAAARMAVFHAAKLRNQPPMRRLIRHRTRNQTEDRIMGLGRGFLLWMLGIPLPIIILLALFWR
jgi:hypothetical protein